VLIAYVVTGMLLDVAHHDDFWPGSGSQATVVRHDCGTHETRIPLDRLHPCVACFQSSQRVATPAQSFIPDSGVFLCFSIIPSLDEQFFSTDYLYTGKRGPPLS
jgi:hypothetical protein